MAYYQFVDHNTGGEYGSFEVFYAPEGEICSGESGECDEGFHDPSKAGWYWWPCFPGCLPESEPIGPFGTEQEAINNARGES